MFGKFKYINMENLSMSQPNLGQKKAPQNMMKIFLLDFIFLKIFFFWEQGREGEREWQKQCVTASHAPPTGNPGMCPDGELNQRPFGSKAGAQSTEPHQPGLIFTWF